MNFNFGSITPGQKPVETNPIFKATSSFNRFEINEPAAKIMGLEKGDKVRIIYNEDAEGLNDKFFVYKTTGEIGAKLTLAGTKYTFTYAGGFAPFFSDDPKCVKGGIEILQELGVLLDKDVLAFALTYKPVSVGTFTYEGETVEMFMLTERTQKAVTRRTAKENADVTVDTTDEVVDMDEDNDVAED